MTFPIVGRNIKYAVVERLQRRYNIIFVRAIPVKRRFLDQFPRPEIVYSQAVIQHPRMAGHQIRTAHGKFPHKSPDQVYREFLPFLKSIPGKVSKHLFRAAVFFFRTAYDTCYYHPPKKDGRSPFL